MRNHCFQLLSILLLISQFSFGQKLKKADRSIVSGIQSHVNFLNSPKLGGRKSGSPGEQIAYEYIQKQFEKQGIKPKAENNSWYQNFNIYDGRQVLPATFFTINGNSLKLYNEYFPFSFSANKKAEASVAIALSENGVPWFADLKDMLDHPNDTAFINPSQLIRLKAGQAAAKGATALIIYNKSDSGQMEYNAIDDGPETSIPVLYVTRSAVSKFLSDESANLELKINIELEKKERNAKNLVGYLDNSADSTIMISAGLDDETNVAALLEAARLIKKSSLRANNYLFVIFSAEQKGLKGAKYFEEHQIANADKISTKIELDSLAAPETGPKGLAKVKQVISIVETTNTAHKVSPNRKA
jgi:hypothetical protein